MKIATLTTSISRDAGGLFAAVLGLSRSLQAEGVDCSTIGFEDRFSAQDSGCWAPLSPVTVPARGPAAFRFSGALDSELRGVNPDVVHVHGIWQYPSICAHRHHRRQGTPYLVSPHGMLDPWALGHSAYKKRLAGWLFENRSLRRAACIHALCDSEARSIRAHGLRNPIAVIPNGVELPVAVLAGPPDSASPSCATPLAGRKVLLYLGRLHQKKGLANLLAAWASVFRGPLSPAPGSWGLMVAGWDQGGHRHELEGLATELGIGESVWFAGPLFGEAKQKAFRGASALVLPSLSEGLPMVVLEAWSFGLPVLMTPQCNIPEGFSEEAALRIEPEVASIRSGLTDLFALSDVERIDMGARGLALVGAQFTWRKVARRMLHVYEWCLQGGEAPPCVRLV